MTCPVCGATNESGAAFCYRCGTPLQSAAPATTGPTVSLNRSDPPSAQPAAPTLAAEETHARVYDAPSMSSTGNPSFTVPSTPQYTQPGHYHPNVGMYPTTSNTALFSLICGILSFVVLPFICAILAIVLGRNAQQEIRASGGRLTGDGMAQAGIVLGWINIALTVLGFCVVCFVFTALRASTSP